MDSVLKDDRFAHISTDVRYRKVPRRERKVKIDKRFEGMFTESNFKVKYTVDKRGRPNEHTTNENLRKYYDVSSSSSEASSSSSSSEDNESEKTAGKSKKKLKKRKAIAKIDEGADSESGGDATREEQKLDVDYARGGASETSSSDEDSCASEEDENQDDMIHPWGELDGDAPTSDIRTDRLAICNMDWDRISARDLYVLLNSFSPPGGNVKNVKVYLSDFGRERLREEDVAGPKELISGNPLDVKDESVGDDQEGEKYHIEKLRRYQLNRLKYYYAIVECDCTWTARKIYRRCNGKEYESSGIMLDVRFVPDDMTFDQEPHSVADGSMTAGGYQPKIFNATALQRAKVKLTWDETDPDRLQVIRKAFEQGDQENMDLGVYLASSDSDGEECRNAPELNRSPEVSNGIRHKDESCSNENDENEDGILKYRALLRGIEENEKKKNENDDVHLEITWGTGLKEKAESMVKNKIAHENSTPWQQYLNQKKERKKQKREEKKKKKNQNGSEEDNPYSDDEVPSDVDLDDPFFKESGVEVNEQKIKKKFKQKIAKDTEDKNQQNAELELLLMEGNDGSDSKHHYSLSKLLKSNAKTKAKNKESEITDNFRVNVEDPRFSAIFSSHAYNIDPSAANFKRTEGMEALIREKQKRQLLNENSRAETLKRERREDNPDREARINESEIAPMRATRAAELSLLVKSVKNKAANLKWKNKKTKPTS